MRCQRRQQAKGFRREHQPNSNRQNGIMGDRLLKFAASALAIALGLAEVRTIAPAAGQPIAQTTIAQNQKANVSTLRVLKGFPIPTTGHRFL